MKPNEIKKALECCTCPVYDCDSCPLYGKLQEDCVCGNHLMKHALAYINQLEEKIDDLERDTIPKLQWSLKRANECGIKTDNENQRLKAEVEKYQENEKKVLRSVKEC